jgi:hypothetical protein
MSTTTDSNKQPNGASPIEHDVDELTDGELESVSGGESTAPRRPL